MQYPRSDQDKTQRNGCDDDETDDGDDQRTPTAAGEFTEIGTGRW
jgi:hypothetical protein